MLQIVKELGSALTSEVDATRAKGASAAVYLRHVNEARADLPTLAGVELLSSVVVKMDKELLDRQTSEDALLARPEDSSRLTFPPRSQNSDDVLRRQAVGEDVSRAMRDGTHRVDDVFDVRNWRRHGGCSRVSYAVHFFRAVSR